MYKLLIVKIIHNYCGALTTDELSLNFQEQVLKAAELNIPKINSTVKVRTLPYWTQDCTDAIKARRQAMQKANKTKTLQDAIIFRKCKAKAQYTLKQAKLQYWQNYCGTLTGNTKTGSVWKTIKSMKGSEYSQIPTLNAASITYKTNKEKADILAKQFQNNSSNANFSPVFIGRQSATVNTMLNSLGTKNNTPSFNLDLKTINEKFTMQELHLALNKCKKNSAPGPDDISYVMLQNLPIIYKEELLTIFNKSWDQGYVPVDWKLSTIKPVLKPSKVPTSLDSYRPIALTSCTGKIMERMITSRLYWFCEKHNLINKHQCGYRQNHSTLDHIIRLSSEAKSALQTGNYTVAIFLDLSKAFEMMWADGLLLKLLNLNITGNCFAWIKDFLHNRQIKVKIDNELSESFIMENGTPQGSSLSPLLFLLMINDFPDLSKFTSPALFADDSSLWRSGTNLELITHHLQEDLTKIQDWCETWGFNINASKSVGIVFTNKNNYKNPNLYINNQKIAFNTSTKFLGITFDSRLTWGPHINSIVERVKPALNILKCLTGTSWGANKDILLTIYKALIRSVLDYGSIAFESAAVVHLRKLDTIQYKALSICHGSMKGTAANTLCVASYELPLDLRREEIKLKYLIKISSSHSHIAKEVLSDKKMLNININHKSVFGKTINDYKSFTKIEIKGFKIPVQAPWTFFNLDIDTNLLHNSSFKNNLDQDKYDSIKINQYITTEYTDSIHIYTDGSKTSKNEVAAAFYIPIMNLKVGFKLPNYLSVYTAELTAITEAVKYSRKNSFDEIVILSDSLDVLRDILFQSSKIRPNAINELHYLIQHTNSIVHLCWVPSHNNILGNSIADKVAKETTSSLSIDLDIPQEINEAYTHLSTFILDKWQSRWTTSITGCKYREICPIVGLKLKEKLRPRHKEVLINRLRFHSCRLNHYLHKIGLHDTGLCDTCEQPETVEHFLTNCVKNVELLRQLKCEAHHIKIVYTPIVGLTTPILIDIIYKYVAKMGRVL